MTEDRLERQKADEEIIGYQKLVEYLDVKE
jgi:hypothetical protein